MLLYGLCLALASSLPPSRLTRPSVLPGKTRTKDKYRVVYSDAQRLELEKEFRYNNYITIKRKLELSRILGLTDRQVSRMERWRNQDYIHRFK